MIDRIITMLPEACRDLAELVAAPILWVPRLQQTMLGLLAYSSYVLTAAIKYVLVLLPMLLGLAALAGTDEVPRATGTVLWFFLLLLSMGSFACVQAVVDAVRKREFKFMVQIVLVEIFVMFFEVMFLYRELVDAITPWIVQQTGD